jgi:hypothetical protein
LATIRSPRAVTNHVAEFMPPLWTRTVASATPQYSTRHERSLSSLITRRSQAPKAATGDRIFAPLYVHLVFM